MVNNLLVRPFFPQGGIGGGTLTLPETNIGSENRPSKKEIGYIWGISMA